VTSHGIRRIERLNYVLGGIAIIVAALTVPQKLALGVALGVVLTSLNFAALRWLVFRWTAAVKAGDEQGSNRIYLILPKMIGMMGAVALVMIFLPIDAIGFLIGYSIFLPSIVIGAVMDTVAPGPADATTTTDPGTGGDGTSTPSSPPSPPSESHG
jgi:hypothetical protein